MVVLVTGSKGQLGQSIQHIASKYPELVFVYTDYLKMDITNLERCDEVFLKYNPKYCINTAAYTAVDKAESEPQKAHLVNVVGASNLAKVCKNHNVILFHISTDFVFDGDISKLSSQSRSKGYLETDFPNPQSVYGQTKLDGELAIQKIWEKHFIIRTSWVYSQFGANFMKTMLRLATERDNLSVVNDQIGTPTNAVDLAEVLLKMIISYHTLRLDESAIPFGIYNFSNEGYCSWYDFAAEIFRQNQVGIDLKPIPTASYPTPAKRPQYSVLDKTKIKKTFNIQVLTWDESLKTNSKML